MILSTQLLNQLKRVKAELDRQDSFSGPITCDPEQKKMMIELAYRGYITKKDETGFIDTNDVFINGVRLTAKGLDQLR